MNPDPKCRDRSDVAVFWEISYDRIWSSGYSRSCEKITDTKARVLEMLNLDMNFIVLWFKKIYYFF